MTMKEFEERLRQDIKSCKTLDEYVDAFAVIAALPVTADYPITQRDDIAGVRYTVDDPMMYHAIGKYDEVRFRFELQRSIPTAPPNLGDTFWELTLVVYYDPKDFPEFAAPDNYDGIWEYDDFMDMEFNSLEERPHADFLAEIHKNELYQKLLDREIQGAEVYLEEFP